MSGYQNFVWEEELCMISKTFAIAVLEDHMRETHRIYKCSVCVFTSSSDKDLKVHTTESHTKYDYKCKIGEYSTYEWDASMILRNTRKLSTNYLQVYPLLFL